MFTPQQLAKFRKALAVVQKHGPALDKLEQIAKHSPQFADIVRDLRTRADYVDTVAKIALEIGDGTTADRDQGEKK